LGVGLWADVKGWIGKGRKHKDENPQMTNGPEVV